MKQEDESKNRQIFRYAFFISIFITVLTQLSGCFGDSDEVTESSAWVRIDSPADGFSTGSETVIIEGDAAMRDGSYPEPVYYVNNGVSGSLPQSTICILACITAFKGEVQLFPGENNITVYLVDGSDTVTVTRYPQVVAHGRVEMDTIGSVPYVTLTLSGDRDSFTRTDTSGEYFFSYLTTGNYSVAAALVPPQSSDCLKFTPDTLDFEVANYDDISGLDFIATQVSPCFQVSGHISANTNPDASISDVRMSLKDIDDNEYVIYTDASGNYSFWHLAPGTYSVTPGDGTYIPETSTVTITDSDVTSIDFIKVFN